MCYGIYASNELAFLRLIKKRIRQILSLISNILNLFFFYFSCRSYVGTYIYAAFNFHDYQDTITDVKISLFHKIVYGYLMFQDFRFKALDAIFEKNKMMKIKKYLYYEVTWSERRLHIEALTLLWIYSEAN